jgi:hypothetical protein
MSFNNCNFSDIGQAYEMLNGQTGTQLNRGKYSYLGESTENSTYPNRFLTERDNPNLFTEKYRDYQMIKEDPKTNHIADDILGNILERTPLSDSFFSKKNIDHLQCLIIRLVRERSDGKWNISRQSDNELITVMRSLYLQYAQHLPFDLKGQLVELNRQVIIDVVPRVMTGVEQHLGYIRDQGSNLNPLPRGEYASSAGTKQNRSITSLFI